MYLTDDPLRDFDRWEAEQRREEERLPKCDFCGEPINNDFLYDLDGSLACEECLVQNFRKRTEDYME